MVAVPFFETCLKHKKHQTQEQPAASHFTSLKTTLPRLRTPPHVCCPPPPSPPLAGVWRLACIEHAGGWNARTTVEDMDLSLRAYLKGWGAIFLDDVTCLNEVGG